MFSPLEDVQYRGAYHEDRGGYHEYCEGYLEYRGGCPVPLGISSLLFEYRGGYRDTCGGIL